MADGITGRLRGGMKWLLGGGLGLVSGAAAMYATALFNTVVKPPMPVANFAVTADGLSVRCENRAAGDSGWWDFGDGSPLEPFDPAQPAVTHAYAKPGNYSVKLTVRNFLLEENARSVPVDLSAAAPQLLPPSVTALQVEPVGQRMAPATFRVKGEVKNAERVIWDLGGDKLEVSTENGPFERLVVFEKPGLFPIQLTGLTGNTADKKAATVKVDPPTAATVSAFLSVTDAGARTERQTVPETIPVPVPEKGAKQLSRVVEARRSCTIIEAKLAGESPAIKNLKAEVAADRRSVTLTGEWAALGEAGRKAAGGSNVLVRLLLTEERAVPVAIPSAQMAGSFAALGQPVVLPMPKAAPGLQRKMKLEFRQTNPDGRSQTLMTVDDLKLPWTGTMPGTTGPAQKLTATQVGDSVQVVWGN
jgi:hypothetical protein